VPSPPAQKVRCRAIKESDREAVINLLLRGFEGRQRSYWQTGLERMSRRRVPEGSQPYGFVIDAGGKLVGILMLIWTTRMQDGAAVRVADVASWYCEPAYRGYAQLLVSVALRDKTASYMNVSPAPHTWPILEKQGYKPYCSGLFFAFAPLMRGVPGTRIERVSAESNPRDIEAMAEYEMLREHASFGCIVLVCRAGGQLHPFIFRPFFIRSGRIPTPGVMTLYCRDQADLVRFAGNIGRYLMWRLMPVIIMDSNGPIPGLAGFYTEKSGRKFCRGPYRPRLGDLSDTEFAIFGM
jgi:hypothetical protein